MSTIKIGDRVRITGENTGCVPELIPGLVHEVVAVDAGNQYFPVVIRCSAPGPGYLSLEAGTFEVVTP